MGSEVLYNSYMKGKMEKVVRGVAKEIEEVGGVDRVILRELVKIAKAKVRKVNTSDKLRAIELIGRIKGWIRDAEIGIQQNILLSLMEDEGRIDRMVEEDEEVEREVRGGK